MFWLYLPSYFLMLVVFACSWKCRGSRNGCGHVCTCWCQLSFQVHPKLERRVIWESIFASVELWNMCQIWASKKLLFHPHRIPLFYILLCILTAPCGLFFKTEKSDPQLNTSSFCEMCAVVNSPCFFCCCCIEPELSTSHQKELVLCFLRFFFNWYI